MSRLVVTRACRYQSKHRTLCSAAFIALQRNTVPRHFGQDIPSPPIASRVYQFSTSAYLRSTQTEQHKSKAMAISVLSVGIPSTAPMVPEVAREKLQKALDFMEADMDASPYDHEFFHILPDMDFDLWIQKLREKKWDIVMVGMGLRTVSSLTVLFEKIINSVHEELPNAKFAFNTEIEKTQEACRRVLAPES